MMKMNCTLLLKEQQINDLPLPLPQAADITELRNLDVLPPLLVGCVKRKEERERTNIP
tara:strand:+ start:258 stop:431 length:174 start_codon:yes stop_codon:yes gene_type:complete